jgi:hypothetical protein
MRGSSENEDFSFLKKNEKNIQITQATKKRGNINMKTSKKKEKLSFTYKNHWCRVLLPRTARPVVGQTVHVSCFL